MVVKESLIGEPMFTNPFTPVFGGKPDIFFGRQIILARFDLAMIDHGSDDRALFISGARGSGKTALLEQMSQRAEKRGWIVLDLGPEDTVAALIHGLVPHDSETKTVNPQLSVSVLGTGGSVGGISTSHTTSFSRENLTGIFLDACNNTHKGIFVTIDEVQKVSLEDVSAICNAFQMASRKGHDVMLAVAGLPYSYENVIHHQGCTYMRRAVHEELGLLSRDETEGAFVSAFKRTKGIALDSGCLTRIIDASYGHPYLIQLIGFYLVTTINENESCKKYKATEEDAARAITAAITAYERRALEPIMSEMSAMMRLYIEGMVASLDETYCAGTADVAAALNKNTATLTRAREALIKSGIIVSPARGKVRFAIPYLRTYAAKTPTQGRNMQLIESWGV